MKAYLLLQDGTVFEGKMAGKQGTVIGEIVFNTSMVGYEEVLEDSAYYGQIVAMTYPLIGNYGINKTDMSFDKSGVRGFIVREICKEPSNFRCEETFDNILKEQGIVAIEGIDTRALTIKLRDDGVMNGAITDSLDNKDELLSKIKDYSIKDALEYVSVKEPREFKIENAKYRVCVMDYGCKKSIISSLINRECDVIKMPAASTIEQVQKYNPDGIVLSDGPGNPSLNTDIINELKRFIESKIPIFGIGLGHQLMALAAGAKTKKLKYGHIGASHPVKDIAKDRTYITTQNHIYTLVEDSINSDVAEVTHISVNDSTVEGIRYKNNRAFSVQFYPDVKSGTIGTSYLFDDFIELMKKNK